MAAASERLHNHHVGTVTMASIKVLAIRPLNGLPPVFVSGSVRDNKGGLENLKTCSDVGQALEFSEGWRYNLHEMRGRHIKSGVVEDYVFMVIDTLKYYQHGNNIHATPPDEVF